MRLLICAGGTGGGVYPALTVLQALGNAAQPVLWVGGEGGMESGLVTRAGIPYETIPAAGVHGVGLKQLPANLFKLFRGWIASRRILRRFNPDVLLFTGGYVAVPMALAALKKQTLLYVPDIEPGLALRVLARFSDVIALTAEESRTYFNRSKKMIVTGYPIRNQLGDFTKESGRQALSLEQDRKVLLVFGGSKGARSINRAVMAVLPDLLHEMQIVHITGTLDWKEAAAEAARIPPELAASYHPYPYLHEEMGAALAAADLVVSRAGASVLGEFPLFGLPAILVPYPFAWRYQKVNADYLVRHQAAVLLENEQLASRLLSTIHELIRDEERLSEMGKAMKLLSRPQAAADIAAALTYLAAGNRASSGGAA